jgi:hypothetical protein
MANLGGRPPMYNTAEELQQKIDDYFNNGVRTKTVLVGKDKEPMELPVPTITGLAYYLGFESRQSFYDYEKKDGFTYTIKRARLFIEVEYEMQLSVGNTTGAIFALKNMGWIDSQKLDHSNNGDKFEARPSIIFTNADKSQ